MGTDQRQANTLAVLGSMVMVSSTLASVKEKHEIGLRRRPFALDDRLYQLIANSEKPIGAYALARTLLTQGYDVVPNQVYRVLRRLLLAGRIRRIATLAAFIPASSTEIELVCICSECNHVKSVPIPSLDRKLKEIACQAPIRVHGYVVEAIGICPKCTALGSLA